MKIIQEPKQFSPVTITLDTYKELLFFKSAFIEVKNSPYATASDRRDAQEIFDRLNAL